MKPDRIVIIGAGQAGVQAVASLRAEGYDGAITLLGEEPFPPYQRPPLSKAYLSGDLARERLFLRPESFFTEARCELRLNASVRAIDRKAKIVRLADGGDLAYDRLLLATGARVRRLPIPGADLGNVFYLRGIDDVDLLRPHFSPRAKLCVVGGGYIGLEVAAVAVKHGLDVTVLETADRVMARAVSLPLSAFFESVHRAAGVKLVLGRSAEAIEGSGVVASVRAGDRRIAADIVLIGVGIVPNVELANEAGLACDNGIVVDETAATSDPDIYAAGDCTNHPAFAPVGHEGRWRLESVQNAIDQAKAAAAGLVGRPRVYREVPWFWSDQYDIKLQIAGIAKPGDAILTRGEPASRKFAVFHTRQGRIAAVEAVNAAPEYIVGRKLIADGKMPDLKALADTTLPMKSFA